MNIFKQIIEGIIYLSILWILILIGFNYYPIIIKVLFLIFGISLSLNIIINKIEDNIHKNKEN
jgi:ethanolamine transporter EutH